ncbi:hypothetical protein SLS56_011154, partial [Neofusicoccum ribis]
MPRGIIISDLPGLYDTTLWLESYGVFIAVMLREYQAMHEFKENEAEYAVYAVEALLKREPRSSHPGDNRSWKYERKL